MSTIYIPVDLTEYYISQSLSIEDDISARSQCRFQFVDKNGILEIDDGMPIEIYDYNDNLVFSGFVIYPQRMNPIGTDVVFFDIEAVDQNSLCDRYLVAESYLNQTAGYIVSDLMAKYLSIDGITAGVIQAGNTIEVAKFPRIGTVTDALDQLAEICGFIWYIDFDKTLHFKERTADVAPFNLVDSSQILNVNLRNDRSKYRNRQYIRGGQTPTDSQILDELPTPKPDDVTRTFVTRYPISEKPIIKINGVPVDPDQIGVNGIDGQVDPLQWYWSYNSNTITQDSNEYVLASTDVLTIDYIGLIPLLVVVEDSNAIEQRATIENVSGVYESLESMPNVNNKQQAIDIANGRLNKYARVARELTYQTYTNGLFAGQLQNVNLTKYNISNSEFLIDRVTMRDLDDNGTFVYDVHAVDGQSFGGWTQFFKSLVKKQSDNVTIDSYESLVVLNATTEVESWTESQNMVIFSCAVPSTTLYPSLVFYPC